ncbi:MAG: transposase, partial [Proteobacteria bacterium]|nr:transposase [Pseudomonadota bacterium]
VAPTLDIRPNIALPDSETLRALLAHRFAAMTDYWRHVMRPALRAQADDGGDAPAKLPRRLRKGLADGGRWLDASARERLQAFVARRPQIATLVEFRARLATVLEERSTDAAASLQRLQAWCEQAEATGIRALQEFSARMKGYAIAVH